MLFKSCNLSEVDFTQTNLSEAIFENCDLCAANFENTILRKADFRTAFNYRLDPEKNDITKAKFSQNGLSGLLNKYNIQID